MNASPPMSTSDTAATSVYQILRERAEHDADTIAIEAPTCEPLTYGCLRAHIESVVDQLNAIGISRKDRVALVMPNGPEMAVAFLAVTATAAAAPLNPACREHEFQFYLSDLKANALLIQSDIQSTARTVAQARGIPIIELHVATGVEAGIFTLQTDMRSHPRQSGFTQTDDIALLLHTSGTTSRPKLVPLTHGNICASAGNTQAVLGLNQHDRCLNVMPLFHVHGLIAALLSSLVAGASVVCAPGFDPVKFYEWLDDMRPTWYTAVPTMHQAILAFAECNRKIITRRQLQFIRSATSSLAPQVMQELEATFHAPVVESYGMTEAAAQITSNPLPPGARKSGSVGPAAGPQVAVVNERGERLVAGQSGEIVIRGTNVMSGYECDEGLNQTVFSDGWLHTGDQGYLDDDGYLFITGRLTEIIKRGGEKVSPREIDEVFLDHPSVAEAVCFPIPDPQLGEDLAIAVVLRKGHDLSEQELQEFASSHLARHKIPTQYFIVDEIPKGPSGKPQRMGLGKDFLDTHESVYQSTRAQIEQRLSEVLASLLQVDKIGIHENLFELGVGSLQLIQFASRIESIFGQRPQLHTLFNSPTIAAIAAKIARLHED